MLSVLAFCPGGICGLQGPPDTGKTTQVAKIAAMTSQQCQLGLGRLAPIAHSNKAVEALLGKLIEYLPNMFQIPVQDMLWVETDGGRTRRLDSEETTDPALEALSIEIRRRALAGAQPASAQPASYANYLAHSSEPEETNAKKAWWRERRSLDSTLRATCKLFVCTISCLNSPFWKLDKNMLG